MSGDWDEHIAGELAGINTSLARIADELCIADPDTHMGTIALSLKHINEWATILSYMGGVVVTLLSERLGADRQTSILVTMLRNRVASLGAEQEKERPK